MTWGSGKSRCAECEKKQRQKRKVKSENPLSTDSQGDILRECGKCGRRKRLKTEYKSPAYTVCTSCLNKQAERRSQADVSSHASSSSSSAPVVPSSRPHELKFKSLEAYITWKNETLTDAPVDLRRKHLTPGKDVDTTALGFDKKRPETFQLKQV